MHLQCVLPHLCYEFLLLLNGKSKESPPRSQSALYRSGKLFLLSVSASLRSSPLILLLLCADPGFLFIAFYYGFHNHIKQYQQVDHCKHLVMLDQVKSI